MKVVVRLTVRLPECTGEIQRLYDDSYFFKLVKESIWDAGKLADFLTKLQLQGGKLIKHLEYISDDDLKEHESFIYELIDE